MSRIFRSNRIVMRTMFQALQTKEGWALIVRDVSGYRDALHLEIKMLFICFFTIILNKIWTKYMIAQIRIIFDLLKYCMYIFIFIFWMYILYNNIIIHKFTIHIYSFLILTLQGRLLFLDTEMSSSKRDFGRESRKKQRRHGAEN